MKKPFMLSIFLLAAIFNSSCQTNSVKGKQFTETLMTDSCTFTTTGRNLYFILEPGYQLVLEGMDGKDKGHLAITVLNETKKIGNVETRVVEENELVNGKTVEISRNFFAFCKETGSVYYFGEEVDMYKDGKVVNHKGAWTAVGSNKAGVAMPGLVLLGARYYQEIAPGIAMDRAEIISMNETKQTPAGNFINCLKIEETTPLELKDKEYKIYAPGVGLIQDEKLLLVKYGFIK
ncbi:MAG: hypothetical protein H0X70_06510 [Segetibacter sp.]|jgi:hypothetical protein|nr:hypothetical protein [Segetibacter sp.]